MGSHPRREGYSSICFAESLDEILLQTVDSLLMLLVDYHNIMPSVSLIKIAHTSIIFRFYLCFSFPCNSSTEYTIFNHLEPQLKSIPPQAARLERNIVQRAGDFGIDNNKKRIDRLIEEYPMQRRHSRISLCPNPNILKLDIFRHR